MRSAATPKDKAGQSSNGRTRVASSSDSRQNVLVSVSLWRVASAPADGGGTLLTKGTRSSLTTLPASWQTGASYASCPLSGYATS